MRNAREVDPLSIQRWGAFFKQKLNLPTKRWDDLGTHARGFMIAAATKTALLKAFFGAVLWQLKQGRKMGRAHQYIQVFLATQSRPVSSCQPRHKMCSPTQARVVAKHLCQSGEAGWFLQHE